jgi:Ni,Fe-hydrogenase maturation factor
VIFIDACMGGTPGLITQEVIIAQRGTGTFTHHLTPTTLLGAAQDLYGACPQAYCLTVTGYDFAYGEKLSAAVQTAVPVVCRALQNFIKQHKKAKKEHV